jgi:uncharacterized protein (TIGR03435 family)
MNLVAKLTLPILVAASLFAQSTPAPQFEVASIRLSDPLDQGTVQVGLHVDGSQIRVARFTLRDYAGMAYRMKISQISGPDWISTQRFDIAGTIPKGVSTSQIPEMVQALLADRFQLKMHREKKEFPVYALLVGKGPLKAKEVPPDANDDPDEPKGTVNVAAGGSAAGVSVNLGHGSSWSFVPNRFEAKKMTMAQIAAYLERFADRTIVDMTDLKGQYDFAFDVNPDDYRPMLIRSAIAAGAVLPPQALSLLDNSSPASLADAVAQTGLKLEARKAMLDVIVVDDAVKTPSAN